MAIIDSYKRSEHSGSALMAYFPVLRDTATIETKNARSNYNRKTVQTYQDTF